MNYRTLGRTGIKVSPLCLGTANFGSPTPADESMHILDRALDAGINLVDTLSVDDDITQIRFTRHSLQHGGLKIAGIAEIERHIKAQDSDIPARLKPIQIRIPQ